jgi:hypothetical protein
MAQTPAAESNEPEPRWQALIALLAVGGLELALPAKLVLGSRWLFPGLVAVLLVPLVVSHRLGRHRIDVALGMTVSAIVTAALIASVILLVRALPSRAEAPGALLVSAASLWVSNILVFSLWYWRLDAGGPHRRDARQDHAEGSFLFPQLTMLPEVRSAFQPDPWRPEFVDYLFLAFNTSTAFSPTDTAVLTRWAKGLMMLQSLISLAVLALLAARAVNIL